MTVSYSKNAGLAPDVDLTLMLRRRAHRLASVLEREAHRLALKLKCEATQACVLMLKCDSEIRVLKSSMTIAFSIERDPCIVLSMKFAFEIGTRPLHLRDSRLS